MATWQDVRDAALALPGVTERAGRDGVRQWQVGDRLVVWERPLRRADRQELGPAAPEGDVLGARVRDVGVKEALVRTQPEVFFTTSHFDGYPAVLVRLDRIAPAELRELVTEAWLERAPKRTVRAFLEQRGLAES